ALFWWSAVSSSMGLPSTLPPKSSMAIWMATAPFLPSTSAYRLDMSVMKPILTLSCAWAVGAMRPAAASTTASVVSCAFVCTCCLLALVYEWMSSDQAPGGTDGGAPGRNMSLPERAAAFRLGGEDLFTLQRGDDLVVVPRLLGLGRRLDLHQVHVMHEPAVGANGTLGVEVVDGRGLELFHDLVGIQGARCLHRLEVVHG